MALIKCGECGKEISYSATVCPNCGCTKPFKDQRLSVKQSKQMSVKERHSFIKSGGKIQMTGLQKFSMYVVTAFLGFIVLLVIIPIIKPQTQDEKAKAEKEAHEKGARITCIAGIQQYLKDPDSVVYKHGPGDRLVLSDGENRWRVQLKLKAKNSFNTYVPATFECKVAYDGQNYKLLSVHEVK